MFGKTFRILTLAVALGIGTPLLAQAGMYARHGASTSPSMVASHPMSMSTSSATLTADEATDLVFMREEEKLARDLYITFDEKWGGTTFASIASSEQRHMDAILRKLVKYQLPDPAAGNEIGEFTNDEVQALYDGLLEDGLASELAALNVGGLVEEIDIVDNMDAAAAATQEDLVRVYEALTCGSRNHLRAFAGRIVALTGQLYVAQYLTQAEVDAILAQPYEQCGWR
jgi:hypothetical protein